MARFNTDSGRSAALKSVASRKAAEAQRAEHALLAAQAPDYAAARLARVRMMIDETEEQYATTRNAQDRERLARALSNLSEIERVLDGRPLPGSRRPGPATERPAHTLIEPL